jgi:hypothetical protein
MNALSSLFLLLLSLTTMAQTDAEFWAKWDKNYPRVDIVNILAYEKHYADSVENDHSIPPYYARLDKYRFKATYLEKVRKTDKEVLASMVRVFKLFAGDPSALKGMCDKEVLFKVGEDEIWMPVQPNILKALKEEVSTGETITIYCLYLNEHTSKNVLYNTFLISEFYK